MGASKFSVDVQSCVLSLPSCRGTWEHLGTPWKTELAPRGASLARRALAPSTPSSVETGLEVVCTFVLGFLLATNLPSL